MAATWRLAKSLSVFRDEVNAKWPGRSKASDGTKGDDAHAARKSDHNPRKGVVHAIDITHDPLHGIDSEKLAELLRTTKDPRISYIISNRKIASGRGGPQPWVWRKYSGTNPHNHHMHLSVRDDLQDDVMPWPLDGVVVKPQPEAAPVPPLLRHGSHGPDVETVQKLLNAAGAKPALVLDQDFGARTEKAVKAFQKAHKLVADGWVGPSTWAALRAS